MTLMHINRLPFFREFDSILHDFGLPFDGETGERARALVPAADIIDLEKAVEIRLDMPGVAPDEIDVKLDGDVLTVSGERKSDKKTESKGWNPPGAIDGQIHPLLHGAQHHRRCQARGDLQARRAGGDTPQEGGGAAEVLQGEGRSVAAHPRGHRRLVARPLVPSRVTGRTAPRRRSPRRRRCRLERASPSSTFSGAPPAPRLCTRNR